MVQVIEDPKTRQKHSAKNTTVNSTTENKLESNNDNLSTGIEQSNYHKTAPETFNHMDINDDSSSKASISSNTINRKRRVQSVDGAQNQAKALHTEMNQFSTRRFLKTR